MTMRNNENADLLSSIASVIDVSVKDFHAARQFVIAHTPANCVPAFVGVCALLCYNGSVRLHEFDELAVKFNLASKKHPIDTTNDNILRSLFACFDMSYIDEQTMTLNKFMQMSADPQIWRAFLCQYVKVEFVNLSFDIAKTIKHSTIIV